MSKSKKYLVHLEGGGDTYYFVVGQATWDWINSDWPEFDDSCCVDETVSAEVIAEATELSPDFDTTVRVTSGSCDNDRAMHLFGLFKTHHKYPRGEYEDCYEGCIY